MTREVLFVSGVRTAIGDYGGGLKDQPPTALGAQVIAEAVRRAGLAGEDVHQVVMGNVLHTEPRDMYLSRVAALDAGLPSRVPALTLNRLCGSGAQAILSAAQMLLLGDGQVAVAGGAEVMSRGLYALPGLRWGQRMGDGAALDMMVGALTDPFGHGHMGVTAENIARERSISREDQDALAVESHKRAAKAIAEGRFKEQILPIEIKTRKGATIVDTDEHVRADASPEGMAKLKTVFQKDGTVTAGNASGINDGAAALVLMERSEAERRGIAPMGRLAGWGLGGVAPEVMGLGPIEAVPQALERAGISVGDLDVIESNEAFAAQACAVARALDFPAEKTNINGGAVALGHPIGATGAILTVKCLYELKRSGGRWGLVTMCIGGGQGIALVVEAQ
ncbi:beta-ketothiolase BktB [Roseospirillum parvum]|uniref:Acetyl-CoA C-acetyltransferase n=1 Tax=Roseospirillum parvum TaxID=83401 RepID=A0A1G7XR63_9PROT|nr:beta-ketothiolase BktB [Roseospirillum parvum]SDG86682.1 acetyl-CoA C-acetyltransferase [Roseospirillum parvum]